MRRGLPALLLAAAVLAAAPAAAGPPMYGQLPEDYAATAAERELAGYVGEHTSLTPDPLLSLAAREYGRTAERADAAGQRLGGEALSDALWRSGVTDADVMPLVIAGGSPAEHRQMVDGFSARAVRGRRFSHFGVGQHEGRVTTVLFARRSVTLAPTPRSLPAGTRREFGFRVDSRLRAPGVLMTTPKQVVRSIPVRPGEGPGEAVGLLSPVDGDGEYMIEIVARGARGPVVAALFPIYYGRPAPTLPTFQVLPVEPPPTTAEAVARARRVLADARTRRGQPPLKTDPTLTRMARSRVAELAGGDLVHASPEGRELLDRLTREHLPVGWTAENLAVGPSPEAAARACLRSPSHLVNVIDERGTHAGLAMQATTGRDGGVQYLLVQVFAELLPVTAGRQLADELVQLINQKRARHGRALLLRHEGLDHVADRHCQRMIREDHFGDQLPGGWDLVDQVREQTTIRRVAVDLFVTPRIDEALESDKLLDPEHRKLGLAVIQGSSPRYGANLLWITVLYGRD